MKTVAIIADVQGWAFDGIAQGIRRHNPHGDLRIDILYERQLFASGRSYTHQILSQYDCLWPFSLFQAYFCMRNGFEDFITVVHMGPLHERQFRGDPLPDMSTYNAKLLAAGNMAKRLLVISPVLQDLWERRRDVDRVHVGLDPQVFFREPLGQIGRAVYPQADTLRVGWVGNPHKHMKRFELVEAAVAQVDGAELVTIPSG